MHLAKMNELFSLMTPEEIDDGLWFVDVCERNGNMGQAEAQRWKDGVFGLAGMLRSP